MSAKIALVGSPQNLRIENDIVVDDEPIDLMKNIPIEVEEIEKLMNSIKK